MTVYRIISAEKARTPISVACELLGVSRSGYHAWATRAPSDRELSDAWLIERIRQIHAANRQVYGSRRVTAELRLGHGIVVSRKRVQRLMREAEISGLVARKRGRTTIRVPGVRVADDLVERKFRPDEPDVLWVADITYLRTWEGLALSRCRPRRLQPPDRRLEHGRPHASRARRRRAADGAAAPPARPRADPPLRPGLATPTARTTQRVRCARSPGPGTRRCDFFQTPTGQTGVTALWRQRIGSDQVASWIPDAQPGKIRDLVGYATDGAGHALGQVHEQILTLPILP